MSITHDSAGADSDFGITEVVVNLGTAASGDAVCWWGSIDGNISMTATDSQSNTYPSDVEVINDGDDKNTEAGYALGASAAALTVTITFGSSTNAGAGASRISGTSLEFIDSASQFQSSTSNPETGNITPTEQDAYFFGGSTDWDGFSAPTGASGGFTFIDGGDITGGAYLVQTGGATADSVTFTSGSGDWVTAGVCLQEAGAGGGGRIMSSLAGAGGLAGPGGIAGEGGGLAG